MLSSSMNGLVISDDRQASLVSKSTRMTLMEAARDFANQSIEEIPADCSGCCACATCHVYVTNDKINELEPIDDDEESMLDQAFHVNNNSRLSCQIEYKENLENIELTLAPE